MKLNKYLKRVAVLKESLNYPNFGLFSTFLLFLQLDISESTLIIKNLLKNCRYIWQCSAFELPQMFTFLQFLRETTSRNSRKIRNGEDKLSEINWIKFLSQLYLYENLNLFFFRSILFNSFFSCFAWKMLLKIHLKEATSVENLRMSASSIMKHDEKAEYKSKHVHNVKDKFFPMLHSVRINVISHDDFSSWKVQFVIERRMIFSFLICCQGNWRVSLDILNFTNLPPPLDYDIPFSFLCIKGWHEGTEYSVIES